MTFISSLGYTGLCASVAMLVAWLIQRRTGDAGIVDVVWSASLGVAAIVAAVTGPGDPTRRIIIGLIASVWSIRLTVYLLIDRILRADHEDGRYLMLREQWEASAQPWFLFFFQIQAFFVLAFATPFYVATHSDTPFGVLDVVGILVWLTALVGESIADRQLARFRADPANRGRTCRIGLWSYSRHPNYFFEWIHWWSYVLLGLGSAWWWLSPAAAFFMLFLLFFVTGIPYTEKRAVASRGDDYRAYQKTTSVFIPWFPKEASS